MNNDEIIKIISGYNQDVVNELIAGIAEGDIQVDSFNKPTIENLNSDRALIYKRRLSHLRSLPGNLAEKLANEVEEFLEVLNNPNATILYTGIFSNKAGKITFCWLFSNPNKAIVIQSFDRRKFNDAEWALLWK